MTDYYVDSNNGSPSSPYASAGAAANTVKDCITAGAGAGDRILVHTGTTPHSETFIASNTWTGPTDTTAGPLYIIGVDHNNSDAYTVSSTDNITSASSYGLSIDGCIAIFGLKIAGTGTGAVNISTDSNELCYFQDVTIDASGKTNINIMYQYGGGISIWKDCSFDNGSDDSSIQVKDSKAEFLGCDFSGTNSTLGLFDVDYADVKLIGCDLTSITGSSATLIHPLAIPSIVELIGCRVPSTLTLTDESVTTYIYETDTDSGNNQYRTELFSGISQATCDVDTGTYRTGGATYDGTNGYSWVLNATDADIKYPPAVTAWNTGFLDTTGSTTFTVYIANATADYADNDVWLEVEYFGSTTTTLKTIGSDGDDDPMSAGTTQTDDTTSTWSPTKTYMQSLSVTATVNKVGSYRWRVCSTVAVDIFVDPAVEIS